MADVKKDLKYFMRNTEPEIVTAPGPDSFKDEDGNVIQFEIKVLTQAEITRINNGYRKRGIATDKKGQALIANGEVVWKTETDNARADPSLDCRGFAVPQPQGRGADEVLQVQRHHRNAAPCIPQDRRIPARYEDCAAGTRHYRPGGR